MDKGLHRSAASFLVIFISGCGIGGEATPNTVEPKTSALATAQPSTQKTILAAYPKRLDDARNRERISALTGADTDHNGVRDDIDLWINRQPYLTSQKRAASQLAKALQNTLMVDRHDQASMHNAQEASRKAVTCVYARFPSDLQPNPHAVIKTLQKSTMNTTERVVVYGLYNEALSGSVGDMPAGSGCE